MYSRLFCPHTMSIPYAQSVPRKPLSLAVIGAWLGRARYHDALLSQPEIKVVAIVDTDDDNRMAKGWSRDIPGRPAIFGSLESLLQAPITVEALLVAPKVSERYAAISAAVLAGISVLTEFPISTSLAETAQVIEAAGAAGIQISPSADYRYHAAVAAMREAIDGGAIGTPERVKCELSFPINATYALENGMIPESLDWYDLLQTVAFRTIDISSSWLGPPRAVNADIDLPHHAAIAGRRAQDPIANLIVTHTEGRTSTHLLKLSRSMHPSERYLLAGDLGTLELVLHAGEATATTMLGPYLRLHQKGVGQSPITLMEPPEEIDMLPLGTERMLAEFVRRCHAEESDSTEILSLLAAMETVYGGFLSAREGIRMPLPLQNPPDIDALLQPE